MKAAATLLALLALTACGSGDGTTDATTDQLNEAAAQSDPAAAAVLRNAAEEMEGGNAQVAQQALQDAGNAQASSPGNAAAPAEANSSMGAKPHAPGDPVPPPKVDGQ